MECPYPGDTQVRRELQKNCDFLKGEEQTDQDCRASSRDLSELARAFCSFLGQSHEFALDDAQVTVLDTEPTPVHLVNFVERVRVSGDNREYHVHVYPKETIFYRGGDMGGTGVDKLEANLPLYLADESTSGLYSRYAQGSAFKTTRACEFWVLTRQNFMLLCEYLNQIPDEAQLSIGPVQVSGLEARSVVQLFAGQKLPSNGTIDIPWEHVRINTDADSDKLPLPIKNYNRLLSTVDSKSKLYPGRAFMHIVCARGFDGIKIPTGFFRVNGSPFHVEYIFCNPNTHLQRFVK